MKLKNISEIFISIIVVLVFAVTLFAGSDDDVKETLQSHFLRFLPSSFLRSILHIFTFCTRYVDDTDDDDGKDEDVGDHDNTHLCFIHMIHDEPSNTLRNAR